MRQLAICLIDYACPLAGVEVEDGLPSTERTLQGPGGCRACFGRYLACGVSGMPSPGYVLIHHTSWEVHVRTALDRTRATHYDGDAEYMCTCGALYSRRELLHLRHPSLQDLSVVDVSSVAFSPSSELLAR